MNFMPVLHICNQWMNVAASPPMHDSACTSNNNDEWTCVRGSALGRSSDTPSRRCAMGLVMQPREQRSCGVVRQQRCDAYAGIGAGIALAVAGVAHDAGETTRDGVGVAQ